jgi:hypothetical protein
MASLPKSENHSLRYHFLDNGVNNESRNQPMASAEFGAESGAYFLQSAPETFPSPMNMNQYQEYQLAPDPHQVPGACPTTTTTTTITHKKVKKGKKQKKKIAGAQVSPSATTATRDNDTSNLDPTCSVVRWETLPSCLIESVVGVTGDLTRHLRATPETRQPLSNIFTKNSRLTYLLILFLLLFFVYRIFR